MLQRAIVIAIGAPIFIAIVVWPGAWPFAVVIAMLTLMAQREFYRATLLAPATPRVAFGYAASLLLWAGAVPLLDPRGASGAGPFLAGPRTAALFFLGLTICIVGSLIAELPRPDRAPLRNLSPTWLGVLYVGWLFPFVVRLRFLAREDLLRSGWPGPAPGSWMAAVEPGAWAVLFVLLVNWSVDTLAYLVGRAAGRHKMSPVLSPNKTWEGAAGGFAGALVVAAALAGWLRLPMPWALSAGVLVGVLAQLGDLCKSAIKREIGVKDFGALLPGHGGILDRFDSLLFTASAVYCLTVMWPG